MKLFVCEYFTGGGLIGKDLSSNFIREGEMIIKSLLASLSKFQKTNQDIEFFFARDYRLRTKKFKNSCLYTPKKNIWSFWESCIEKSDAFWPIAPETENILERLSQIAIKRKKILIGSLPKAIRQTKNKHLTNKILQRNRLPIIPSRIFKKISPKFLKNLEKRNWILKPIDGAGADEVFILNKATKEIIDVIEKKIRNRMFILQPYLTGQVMSVSAIFAKDDFIPLTCNKLIINPSKGSIHYQKIEVGGAEFLRNEMTRIVKKIHTAFGGLLGYVGIDFIKNRKNLVVLEINPRLTTSYVGLARSINFNPVEIILKQFDKNYQNMREVKKRKLTVKKVMINVSR
ncbi:MAG: ATP-grasp domain-containing protein [Pseudomonadota bacterium]|nr:ATP-grasp domain-containing protein [Pseudomonadota bacterium]